MGKQYQINLKILQCNNNSIQLGLYQIQNGKKGAKHYFVYLVNGWKRCSAEYGDCYFVDSEGEQIPIKSKKEQICFDESSIIGCEIILYPLNKKIYTKKYQDCQQRVIGTLNFMHNGKIIQIDDPLMITCCEEENEFLPPLSYCFGINIFDGAVLEII